MAGDLPGNLDIALKAFEIVALLGGGGMIVFRLGRTTERVEQTLVIQNKILEQQSDEIRSLKDETKKVNDVLLTIALQKREIELLNERYEELRHGEGYVFPLTRTPQP